MAYGPEGDWARLFRTAPGFLGTTLLKGEGPPPEYLTLDRRCETLTAVEKEIGAFDEVGGR